MSPSRAHLERRRRRLEIEEEGRRRRASEVGRREGGGGGWLLSLFFGWGWGSVDEEEEDDDASGGNGEDRDDGRSIGLTSEADHRPPRRLGSASRDAMCGASPPSTPAPPFERRRHSADSIWRRTRGVRDVASLL
jgi:hypothetical protein